MGEKWAIWALVAALASAGSAHAENVVLHVSADGARRLDKLTPALPEQLTIPRTVTEVSQCSSRNGTIDVQNGQLDLVWHDFQLDIEGDRIVIETVVDIDASGDIDVDNLACFIGASCQVGVHGDSVALRTEIALMTEEGGKLAFVPYNTMVDIGGVNGLNIDIDGCFLGSVAELAIDLIDSWAQSWFDEELGALASEALSSVLGELPLALPERLQLANYVMYSDFEYADVDPAAGITVGASARIGSSFGTIPSLDENAPAPTEPAIVGEGAADFQLAASDQLVSSALRQAWWDGAFSKLLSEGQPSFEISSDSLSQRLGLPAGTQVDVGIEVLDQPTVAFGRDEVDEVSIVLPDTVVKFTLRSPGAPAGTIELRTSGHVVGGFRIGAGGALVLEARAMQIDRLQ
ncbi:MAG: hypothetical protein KJO07_02000, partial [Deltaproteobacteria bacterium]|nr:hypothetical protein [Deltaproteobacteria bacterium]